MKILLFAMTIIFTCLSGIVTDIYGLKALGENLLLCSFFSAVVLAYYVCYKG